MPDAARAFRRSRFAHRADAGRDARRARRPGPRLPDVLRRGTDRARGGVAPEASPVLRREALRAVPQLRPGRAARRGCTPRGARPCGQRRLAPRSRPRARTRADRNNPRARSCGGLALRAGGDARRLRLPARGGVSVQRTAGGRAVEPADELAVLRSDAILVAVLHRSLEALRERLRGRAVVQVLEPLLAGRADPLLLLSDIRHSREKARSSRAAAWYQRVPSLYSRGWMSAPAAGSHGRRRSSRSPPGSREYSASSGR